MQKVNTQWQKYVETIFADAEVETLCKQFFNLTQVDEQDFTALSETLAKLYKRFAMLNVSEDDYDDLYEIYMGLIADNFV